MKECFCFISLPMLGKEFLAYIHQSMYIDQYLSSLCIYFPELESKELLRIYQPVDDYFYNCQSTFYEQGLENGDWLIIF